MATQSYEEGLPSVGRLVWWVGRVVVAEHQGWSCDVVQSSEDQGLVYCCCLMVRVVLGSSNRLTGLLAAAVMACLAKGADCGELVNVSVTAVLRKTLP